MNRLIEFRGKAKCSIEELNEAGFIHDNGWVYGSYVDGYIINGVVESTDEYIAIENWCPVKIKTVGQYTGLKDKNGKEIYEGDIVKYKFAFYRDISKVEFNQDIAAFDMVSIKELDDNSSMRAFKKGSRRGFNKDLVAGFDYVEVIGNIHENPELLEKIE